MKLSNWIFVTFGLGTREVRTNHKSDQTGSKGPNKLNNADGINGNRTKQVRTISAQLCMFGNIPNMVRMSIKFMSYVIQ